MCGRKPGGFWEERMLTIPIDDERAKSLISVIRGGDTDGLRRMFNAHPDLPNVRIVDDRGISRTLLHVATDWPGHFPNGAMIVADLIAGGVDVDAGVIHPGSGGAPETALHWAASSDDVEVIEALLDGGADIEAPGAAFTGGSPMSDAVVFAQWRAARKLLERGAATTLWQAAALGQLDRVQHLCLQAPPPSAEQITNAFWHACRGGQREIAEFLLSRGADRNWVGYDHKSPLDAAHESGSSDLVAWLNANGAFRANEL
jgi:hypothetical protein